MSQLIVKHNHLSSDLQIIALVTGFPGLLFLYIKIHITNSFLHQNIYPLNMISK